MNGLDARLAAELAQLRERDLYRVRRVVAGAHGVELEVDGRRCVNFCANDYLGLAADPRLADAARRALGDSGTGSGAAALVSGYNREHRRLEEALAQYTGRPRALLFSSGWAANLGVVRALLGRGDTLVADALNHASLIDAGRLSGAHCVRVAHADTAAFERALSEAQRAGGRVLLASDAVFSMDGDRADVPSLAALCARHDAGFLLDDAHGFGVLGAEGRGAAECLAPGPDAYVATLGKALGVAGAFVAGSEALIEYLIQRARTWVFSTAPPPALAAAARAALAIVAAEPERRDRLHANVAHLRAGALQRGIALGDSRTPIQPLLLGAETRALAVSAALFQRGYWVAAIRPPTVPAGTARLRITLSAAHTRAQIEGLLDALAESLRTVARAA